MKICFILSRINQPAPPSSDRRIDGHQWALDIIESNADGPYYPHLAEHMDPSSYRFFAGRIAGVQPSSELPTGHPVAVSSAADWSFAGDEPGGSWIALKFDRQSDIVSLAGDVFLLQRWFYLQNGERWYFSNSLHFLHQHAQPRPEIDERSIPYMLIFGFMPNRYTPLKGVYSVRPGQSLTVECGQATISQRVHLPLERPDPEVFTGMDSNALKVKTCEGVLALIREAVASELKYLDSVTIPISGGMDSRFALGCALEVMPKDRIVTYTYGHPNSLDFQLGTGLAKQLGLRSIPVPMDTRPVEEILKDSFQCSEGMYLAFPNYPIGPLRDVLQPGTHVLSGYLGDTMWGSEDLSKPTDLAIDGDMGEHLFKLVLAKGLHCSITHVRKLLVADDWDAFGYKAAICALPGATLDERYSRWFAGDRDTNRINYALQMHRDRAFFLAPHVHSRIVKFAHGMPVEMRRKGFAYNAAMKTGFPELYGYPTTRNFGYPLEKNVKWRRRIIRRYWAIMSELEKQVFRVTGELFFHPRSGRRTYAHPLELQRNIHRSTVMQCLDELNPMTILDPKGIARLREAYYRRRPYPPQLLRSLITIHQWQKYYGKN
ncbi:hypothetical protein KKH18_05695 [bacterium]|nr:hypothetical protein [bacterium]